MTSLTSQDGKLVVRDGKLGTEQACCCGCESSGPYCSLSISISQENECPPSPVDGLDTARSDPVDGFVTCSYTGFVADCNDCNALGGECNDPCNPLP